jgi:hypothetical protein
VVVVIATVRDARFAAWITIGDVIPVAIVRLHAVAAGKAAVANVKTSAAALVPELLKRAVAVELTVPGVTLTSKA